MGNLLYEEEACLGTMSGNPGQFRDFNKSANDLLTKVFPKKTGQNTWGIELELNPTKGNKFGAKIVNAGGVSTGEVSTEFALTDFGVKSKILFKTDKPTLEASWQVSDKIPVDGLSAKLHFDASSSSQTAVVSFAYEHKFVTLNARAYIPVSVRILTLPRTWLTRIPSSTSTRSLLTLTTSLSLEVRPRCRCPSTGTVSWTRPRSRWDIEMENCLPRRCRSSSRERRPTAR